MLQGPHLSSVTFRRGSNNSRRRSVGAHLAVKLASRRVPQSPWFLETPPRSRSATSNVLNLAEQV